METELTIQLKQFFNKIVNTYGDEMAYAIATWNEDIKDSITCYSREKFDKYEPLDFYKELIKNEVMCNDDENLMVDATKKLLNLDNVNCVIDCIKYNYTYRHTIIKSFIDNSNIPFEKKLSKCNEGNINYYLNMIDNYTEKKEIEFDNKKKKAKH